MVYLRIFCLSILFAIGCSYEHSNDAVLLSSHEKDSISKLKLEELFKTHQGSQRAMTIIDEMLEVDSTNAEAWRERSIPYLKRGYPHEWFANYQKAIEYGAEEWIGWRGYCYLFFYKDYQRAIQDFNATDTLTPGFTDYPQAMSVHFLRGICYYGLNEFDSSQSYFQRYINEEMAGSGGFDYIDQNVYLYRGRIFQKLGDHQAAIQEFETGLKIFDQSSDLYYHMSRSYIALGNESMAKSTAAKAKEFFEIGYFHHRPYIEVLDQIYDYDIKELLLELKLS